MGGVLGIGVGSRYRACERCDAGKSRTSTKSESVYQGRRDGMAGIRIDFTAWLWCWVSREWSLSMGSPSPRQRMEKCAKMYAKRTEKTNRLDDVLCKRRPDMSYCISPHLLWASNAGAHESAGCVATGRGRASVSGGRPLRN